jgi:hypothetical protein
MIEKVRILEKDFPTKIPEDIGYKPLEVINEAGETIALFYSTAFMTEKFDAPVSYCDKYDEIFNVYYYWNGLEESDEEIREEGQKVIDESNLEPSSFDIVHGQAMVALGRLTYPYYLSEYEDEILAELGFTYLDIYDEFVDLLISYGDHKIISKLMDLLLNKHIPYTSDSAEDFFNLLFKHNYAAWFEKPDLFFTNENIDLYPELAQTCKNTEMVAFLLDYKNKHFPPSTDYTLRIDP